MRQTMQRIRRGLLDLAPAIYRARLPLDDLRWLPLGTGVPPEERPIPDKRQPGWRPIAVSQHWGGRDENAWFHATARIPAAWRSVLDESPDGGMAVVLRFLLGRGSDFGWPEGLLYVNGRVWQGINRHHDDVLLRPEDAEAAGALTFDVRAWSGMAAQDHRLETAEIALLSRDCEALYFLLAMGADVVDALAEDTPPRAPLAAALETAYDRLDLRQPAEPAFEDSARAALAGLRAALASLRARYDGTARPIVTAIGHGHLDVAWLWQLRHTREKAARTFGIATALMEQYPEYVFLHSTPQVFAALKSDYPEIYARVRERIAEGRFEVAGAMWVESDCNLIAGESLVRQLLYGQRFLREEFGVECDLLWLPDAFGYSAALPQILLKSGIATFVTTKLSWSETNRIPADTFRWRGIDGSDVLAHFITTPSLNPSPPLNRTDTYNGVLTPPAVLGLWRRYQEKALNDELLLAFGFGDGGAGPPRQQLEQARAMRELPGLPELRLGRADEYFARLRARVWDRADLPIWDGELYLEYHRGTYTSQAWLKRAHRRNEARLLATELTDAWRMALGPEGEAADAETDATDAAALDDAWRTLLTHEFHDILPGSSIHEVYEDARVAMDTLAARLDDHIAGNLTGIAGALAAPEGSLLVLNPSPWPRDVLLTVPASGTLPHGWAIADSTDDAAGGQLPVQELADSGADGSRHVLLEIPEVPALGYRLLRASGGHASGSSPSLAPSLARGADGVLENSCIRLALDARGEIISLVDKRIPGGRELLVAGRTGNALQIFDDRPRDFDAWDIETDFERKPYALDSAEVALVEEGPLRATLRVTHRMRASVIEQRISICRGSPRIDFATRIDWHEHHLLLKTAFPLDLRATWATYEVQYGSVERPTHRNTSWESARFEVPAHRWVDISESDYGVSLLNDGRYGHDVNGGTLRLTLLRSPTSPDPEADQGLHEVTYSLLPHLGDWRAAGTIREAYALNRPALTHWVQDRMRDRVRGAAGSAGSPGSPRPAAGGLFAAEPGNVVIEAVKRAADGDGLIVRLYEAHGARVAARVRAAFPLAGVVECDLLERPLTADGSPAYPAWAASPVASHEPPILDADGWTCALRPFEIRTFRVRRD